jgi:hypothetical protein
MFGQSPHRKDGKKSWKNKKATLVLAAQSSTVVKAVVKEQTN